MAFWSLAVVVVSCLVSSTYYPQECWREHLISKTELGGSVAGSQVGQIPELTPTFSGDSVDVALTAEAALAWDEQTGAILYEKNIDEHRPVASLSKLLAALAIRDTLPTSAVVVIPEEVRRTQRRGAHIRLPVGEHASVYDLLAAGLIASANDALTTLAYATAGSEESFAELANRFALRRGFTDTRISNSTGLDGGEQFSTARDIKGLFRLAYRDQTLRNLLVSESGTLRTQEGSVRNYTSTNKLIGTYFPVLAGKTGYTPSAGQNLVVMTYGDDGQRIGAVVLGSRARFEDMKTLVEWVKRNYNWP